MNGVFEHSLQADNDLKFGIVKALRRREPAIDFVSAQEAGLDGVGDPQLLDRAAAEKFRVPTFQDLHEAVLQRRKKWDVTERCTTGLSAAALPRAILLVSMDTGG